MWKQSRCPSSTAESRPKATVMPARAGMAGPAVDTGATGRNTNHTTDSFFTGETKGQRQGKTEVSTGRTVSHKGSRMGCVNFSYEPELPDITLG